MIQGPKIGEEGKDARLEQQFRIQLQETGEGMIFICDLNYS